MRRKNLLDSPKLLEIKKRRRKVLKIKLAVFFGATLFLFIAFVFILRAPKLNISEVNVLGNKIIETKDINKIVDSILSEKYFWVIPKTSLLFIPKDKIREELGLNYHRLKDIEISVAGDRILEVFVSEREPLYTWCGEVLDYSVSLTDTKCYFIDNSGYIFDEAPYFSGDVYFRFFGDVAKPENPSGEYFFGFEFVKLESFYKLIASFELKPVSLQILGDDLAHIYLASNHEGELVPKIIFNPKDDLLLLAENLQSALLVDPLKTQIKENYDNLSYIELRFENKVYYKFR